MGKKTFAAHVFVTDLGEAKQFYNGTLNWPIEDDATADGFVVFTALLVEKFEPPRKKASPHAVPADQHIEEELAALKKDAKKKRVKLGTTKLVIDEEAEQEETAGKQAGKKMLPAVRPSKNSTLPRKVKKDKP